MRAKGGGSLRYALPREEKNDRFKTAGDTDLPEDVLEVGFDGVAREAQLIGHYLVRFSQDEQIHDLLLAHAEIQFRTIHRRSGVRGRRAAQPRQHHRMEIGKIRRSWICSSWENRTRKW